MSFSSVPLFNDNEPASLEKINAIISNMNYLNDSKISMRYDAYGTLLTNNMKVAVGTIDVTTNASFRNRQVFIPDFFTTGFRPVVNASLSTLSRRRSFVTISNLTNTSASIENTGFACHVESGTGESLTGGQIVNWIAIGY